MANSILFNDLMSYFAKIIIKSPKRFNAYETPESARLGRLYVLSKDGKATAFDLVNHVSGKFRRDPSLSNEARDIDLSGSYSKAAFNEVSAYMRKEFIANFKETNKYVLNLAGEPYIDKTNPIESDPRIVVTGKDPDISGQEMYLDEVDERYYPLTYSYYFKQDVPDGVDFYIKENPGVMYLASLRNPTSYYDTRNASTYQIISYDIGGFSDAYNNVIISTYNTCRNFLIKIMKSNAIVHTNYFDEYFVTILIFVTISKLMTTMFDQYIDGVIIPVDIKSSFMKSYGCGSLVTSLSADALDSVIRVMPQLTYFKGTDTALKMVLDIMGIPTDNLKQHYIVKIHTKDNEPIDKSYVDSASETYDLGIVEVPFGDDPSKYVNNRGVSIIKSYEDFVAEDITWGGPKKVDKKRLESELKRLRMNYILTKYITVEYEFENVSIGYKFSLYFSSLLRLLTQGDSNLLNSASFTNTKVKPSGGLITLPGAVAAIMHLMCVYGGNDDIINRTSKKKEIGINFDANHTIIQEYEVCDVFDGYKKIKDILTEEELSWLYTTCVELSSPIATTSGYADAFTIALDAYSTIMKKLKMPGISSRRNAFYAIREYLFTTNEITTSYAGYTRYLEYLRDTDFELYNAVRSVVKLNESIPDYVNMLMENIVTALDNKVFLQFGQSIKLSTSVQTTSGSNSFDEGVLELLNYFKSWVIQVRAVRPSYSVNEESQDYISITNDVRIASEVELYDFIYSEDSVQVESSMEVNERVRMLDMCDVESKPMRYDDKSRVYDEAEVSAFVDITDHILREETVEVSQASVDVVDRARFRDHVVVHAKQ
jgi:hypothetical protein